MVKLLLIASLLFGFLCHAGDSVENGGGLAEQNFQMAFLKSEDVFSLCLASADCLQTSDEKAVLQKIITSLPDEKMTSPYLIFESSSATGRFKSGQVFVTEARPGAPIYINVDEIYSGPTAVPMPESRALKTLTQALLIHQNVSGPYFQEVFSLKIEAFFLHNQ